MLKILIIFFLFPGLIYSQQIINQKQDGEPIEIYAEQGIEWHKNDNKYLAIGNAIAKSGKMSLNSDRIESNFSQNRDENCKSCVDFCSKFVKIHETCMSIFDSLSI